LERHITSAISDRLVSCAISGPSTEPGIAGWPYALNANSDRPLRLFAEPFSGESFDMVRLVARRSSDNAALYSSYLLRDSHGVPCLYVR
jgi:hypothetical protein